MQAREGILERGLLGRWRAMPDANRRFWIVVLVVGLASGVGAAGLVRLLLLVERVAWPWQGSLWASARASTPLHRVLVLGAGGALISATALVLRRSVGGHGTAGILEAIWGAEPDYSLRRALFRGVLAIVVVGLGAPLGREGALVSTSAGIGSWLSRRLKLPPDRARVLVACGGAAGIAAAYNVPLGGAFFGLEVLLGSFALELFGPIVLSCVVATGISHILIGTAAAYPIPAYRLSGSWAVLGVLLAGPAFGVVAASYKLGIEALTSIQDRAPLPIRPWLPLFAMLLTGVAATQVPGILGNGYDVVDAALRSTIPLDLLLLLPFAKLAATSLCSGSGVPGGLFTPSLFYGGLLGGAMGAGLEHFFPGAAPPGAWVLLGMGAVLAGTTHAAVAAIVIMVELTRDYALILPLVATCVIATFVSRSLMPDSLYTGVLRRRGVPLPQTPRPRWMRERPLAPLVDPLVATLGPRVPFSEVAVRLLALPPGRDLYVVNEAGVLLGTVVLDIIKGHLPDASLSVVIAADLMEHTATLHSYDPISAAVAAMSETEMERLPVVDADGRLVGTVSKQDILRAGA